MGIREDIESGTCREEYLRIDFAVDVLAEHTQTARGDVARWLIKNQFQDKLASYLREDCGNTRKISSPAPGNNDGGLSLRALNFIASSGRITLFIFWHIPTLVAQLEQAGERVEESMFFDVANSKKSPTSQQGAIQNRDDLSDSNMVAALRARVLELEAEVVRLRSASPAQTNAFEYCASDGRLTFNYETKGLLLVAAVQERYLGTNYDPQDADTRPAKAHVIDWLKSAKGVESNVAAAAIDRVAMPFERGK